MRHLRGPELQASSCPASASHRAITSTGMSTITCTRSIRSISRGSRSKTTYHLTRVPRPAASRSSASERSRSANSRRRESTPNACRSSSKWRLTGGSQCSRSLRPTKLPWRPRSKRGSHSSRFSVRSRWIPSISLPSRERCSSYRSSKTYCKA